MINRAIADFSGKTDISNAQLKGLEPPRTPSARKRENPIHAVFLRDIRVLQEPANRRNGLNGLTGCICGSGLQLRMIDDPKNTFKIEI
jgi:hypothetical protein